MPKASWDWKRKNGGVQWADVWLWADDVWTGHQMIVEVCIGPPTGSRTSPHGTLTVTVKGQVEGVGFVPRAMKWAALPDPVKGNAEGVALRLLIDIINSLDSIASTAKAGDRSAADKLW